MIHLAKNLNVPEKFMIPWANGVMERLWHFTAMYAPCGDVGRIPDEAIARACMWPESESHAFIEALVGAGWIQKSDFFRLVVHDWHEHCEDSVHTKVARRRAVFFNGSIPKLTGLRRDEKELLAAFYRITPPQPVATPLQPLETPSKPVENSKPKQESGDVWFEEIYTRHPKKKDRGIAANYLSEITVDRVEFDRVHLLWCAEWGKDKPQFAPSLAQWILDQGWKYPPNGNGNGHGNGYVDKNQTRRDQVNEGAKMLRRMR